MDEKKKHLLQYKCFFFMCVRALKSNDESNEHEKCEDEHVACRFSKQRVEGRSNTMVKLEPSNGVHYQIKGWNDIYPQGQGALKVNEKPQRGEHGDCHEAVEKIGSGR